MIPSAVTAAAKADLLTKVIRNKYTFPRYVKPSTLNRDIHDWLAIGDSFAAGITADVPADELNWSCSRFKMAYPNQMNENPRFPGFKSSRIFVFGACTGATMEDLVTKQLNSGTPKLSDTYPNIGWPQIATISISGNDLGFGDVSVSVLRVERFVLLAKKYQPDCQRLPLSLGIQLSGTSICKHSETSMGTTNSVVISPSPNYPDRPKGLVNGWMFVAWTAHALVRAG